MKPLPEQIKFSRRLLAKMIWDEETEDKFKTPSNIAKLKRLTEDLPELEDFLNPNGGSHREYKIVNGIIEMQGLMKNDKFALGYTKVYVKKPPAVMEKHIHPEDEWIGVIDRAIAVEMDGKIAKIKPGEVIYIPANVPHEVSYTQGCSQWVVTMPGNPDFPEGIYDAG